MIIFATTLFFFFFLSFNSERRPQETRELNGACKEPMLEAKKMRYALAPTLPDLQFNITL